MAQAPLSLKARAIALLAQREHSRTELRRKLLRIERARLASSLAGDGAAAQGDAVDVDAREAVEAVVEALLDSLAAASYLCETRFVESRLHQRAGRFGTQRIQQELAQHGLRLSAEQQGSLRDSEYQRALEVWQRRFGRPGEDEGREPHTDPAAAAREHARQTRFLLARGFSAEVVRRVLRGRG